MQMTAGCCLVFAGTLLHRGGANHSAGTRRAFSNQYCQPWARTQENFFLAIPQREVAAMSATVQSLLGYSIHPPFMGQLSAYHPAKALHEGFVPPAYRVEPRTSCELLHRSHSSIDLGVYERQDACVPTRFLTFK